jgi:hypothetical protein
VLTDPAAQDFLMSGSVYCGDNHISLDDLAWLNLNLGHLLLPQVPLLVIQAYLIVNEGRIADAGHRYAAELIQLVAKVCASQEIH